LIGTNSNAFSGFSANFSPSQVLLKLITLIALALITCIHPPLSLFFDLPSEKHTNEIGHKTMHFRFAPTHGFGWLPFPL